MIYQSLIFAFLSFLHSFHVSTADLNYNKKNNALEMTIRIFADDLEKAIANRTKEKFVIDSDSSDVNPQIKSYIREHLSFKDKHRTMPLNFVGIKLDDDLVRIYLKVDKVNTLKNITIQNTILIAEFNDQVNLTHFKENPLVDITTYKFTSTAMIHHLKNRQ